MKLLSILFAIALIGCSDHSEEEQDARTPEELRTAIEVAMKSEDFPTAEKALTALIGHDPDDFDSVGGRAAVRVFLGMRLVLKRTSRLQSRLMQRRERR